MSDSILQLSPQLQYTLQRINNALLERNDAALEAAFEGVDIERLLSDDTLERVRARSKPALTIFLASLAVSNDINVKKATQWRDAYQSVAQGALTGTMSALPNNNIFKLAVHALTHQSTLLVTQLSRAVGGDTQWIEGFELLIDHKDWSSALAILEHMSKRDVAAVRWLQMARVLTKRQRLFADESGNPQPDVDYITLAHLFGYVATACLQHHAPEVTLAMRHLQAKCLEVAQAYDQAIQVLRGVAGRDASTASDLAIARCECKRGDLEASIRTLDATIPKYAQEKAPQHHETQGEPASEKTQSFNVNNAGLALADLASVLNEIDQKFFLVSGTLLGYAREGKLMDHDKDVDVGIFGWEQQFEICMALQRSGCFTVSAHFLKGTNSYYIPVMHTKTGMWIDLFLYHEQEGKWVTGVDFFFGYRQTFAFTPFALKPVQFLGVDMFVPEDTALNMEENFGEGWQTPDTSYISHLESPSTMHKGGLEHMLTARVNVFAAIQKRSPAKLRKIAQVMARYEDQPAHMTPEQINWLYQLADRFESEASHQALRTAEAAHA